jgi:protein gp37
MSKRTSIEWTENSWNPVTGCTKISPGCKNCYAERMAIRLQSMGLEKYSNGFKVKLQPDSLNEPYTWKKPGKIFVNSMSDLFHKNIPESFIMDVFKVMNDCPWHIFQILTKRENRLLELNHKINWTQNIWMGVSIENKDYTHRANILSKTDAYIKFISFEPLLGPILKINLKNIDWVILGGESGPNARPMKKEWVEEIKDHCEKACVKFFFKQWGGVQKKKNGRLLNGKTYNEYPEINISNLSPQLSFGT